MRMVRSKAINGFFELFELAAVARMHGDSLKEGETSFSILH